MDVCIIALCRRLEVRNGGLVAAVGTRDLNPANRHWEDVEGSHAADDSTVGTAAAIVAGLNTQKASKKLQTP